MGAVFLSVASSIMATNLPPRSRDSHSSGGVTHGVTRPQPDEALEQDRLKSEHCRERADCRGCDHANRSLPDGVGKELASDHPGHGARGKSEGRGKDSLEGVDEEERGHREKGLREARKEAPNGCRGK